MYTHSQKEMERQQIWVNTIADQRYKINHWACRGGELNQMMEERFVKGNELMSVLELMQKLGKKSLQYRPKQTLEEIVLDIHACYKQE